MSNSVSDASKANGYKFNYDYTADCLEHAQVKIEGPDPKKFDCYTVTLKVGPEEYVETSRSPYTALAYALEAFAKRLKNTIPQAL